MYVDTTFCIPEAFYIPSRDDCLAATASLVVAWLRESPDRFVHISSKSKYGHEPLLAHLSKEAGTQVRCVTLLVLKKTTTNKQTKHTNVSDTCMSQCWSG
jgi:hypothetical protein